MNPTSSSTSQRTRGSCSSRGLLVGDVAGLGDIGRFLPGSAAAAISGQDPGTLLAPAVALALLVLYAVAAALAGSLVISRRDVG